MLRTLMTRRMKLLTEMQQVKKWSKTDNTLIYTPKRLKLAVNHDIILWLIL